MSINETSFMAADERAGMREWLRHQTGASRVVVGTMLRADPIRTVCLLVLRPANAAGSVIAALWLKYIIEDTVIERSGSIALGATGFGLTFALVLLSSWLSVLLEARLQERTTHEFDHRVARAILGQPSLELLDTPAYRDRLELLKDDSASLPTTVSAMVDVLAAAGAATISVVVLVAIDPILLALVVAAVPSLLVGRKAETVRQRVLLETAEATRAASDIFGLATSPQAAKEARTLGLRDELIDRYGRVSRDIVLARRRAWYEWSALQSLSWLIFIAAFTGCLFQVASQASAGRVSPGDLVIVVLVGAQVNVTIAVLAYSVTFALGSMHAVDRLIWIERARHPAPRPVGQHPHRVDGRGIELRGLGYSYPDGTTALDGISLSLPPGSVTAIVGDNGAGKSTLIMVLARLYEPLEGEMVLDGRSHHEIDPTEWRRRVSGIFQGYARFQLRAGQTVGVGDLERIDDRGSVEVAMERAGAGGLMGELPQGPDTHLGSSFSQGYEPSGGQWQKLALGRGMMRGSPRLLLLDEPMAALDPVAEDRLMTSYTKICREEVRATGAMAVITSHRLPIVGLADQIVVLDEGRIIEVGSHTELVAAGGSYAELYETQARAFRESP